MIVDTALKQNDLLPALTIVCRDAIGPVDLNGVTPLFRMVNVRTGAVKVNDDATVVSDPVFTASGATLAATSHGLNDGDDVTLKSSGALPGGLSAQKKYFVINATANTLRLSLVENGTAITTTSAGSGTHTLLAGRVAYEWATGDTDEPGTYFGEVQTTQGGKPLTYPNDRQLLIEVVSDLV